MVGFVPVADEKGEVAGRVGEWDGNMGPAEDPDAAEAAGCLVEAEGGEVEEAADLVLHLEHVSEVLPRRNGTVRPQHAVLPRVPPLLYPVPVLPVRIAPNQFKRYIFQTASLPERNYRVPNIHRLFLKPLFVFSSSDPRTMKVR